MGGKGHHGGFGWAAWSLLYLAYVAIIRLLGGLCDNKSVIIAWPLRPKNAISFEKLNDPLSVGSIFVKAVKTGEILLNEVLRYTKHTYMNLLDFAEVALLGRFSARQPHKEFPE